MLKPATLLAIATLGLTMLGVAACSNDSELAGDLEIGGTVPASWTVQVKHADGRSAISILGEANFDGALPVKSSGEGGATLLTSKTVEGDFVMTFTRKECFDGLAEIARPWTVTVSWKGEVLEGCARPVEVAPKPASG